MDAPDRTRDLQQKLDDAERRLRATTEALDEARTRLRECTEREATSRSAAVARLSGGIAHEINNPLTVLQLRIDLMAEDRAVPESVRHQLEVLRTAIARIARTIRTLQQVGRPVRSAPERVDVGDALIRAIRSAPARSLLTLEPLPGAIGVHGDPLALALALEQMVLWAGDAGGGSARVGVQDDRVWIELRVAHATVGDGEVFGPAAVADSPEGRFPGVALTVAAGMARDLGGELRTGHDPDHGSFVRLELPHAPGPRE